jgi:uncharacterized protein
MAIRVGNKAEGRDFFDRVTEREDIWRYLEGNHVLLSGPRRLGKTSLLQRLAEETHDKGLWAQLVDVEGVDSVEVFIAALDRAFPDDSMTGYLKSAGNTLSAWLERIRKVDLKLPGGIGGGIEVQAKPDASWADAAIRLQERLSGAPLLIFIDEFSVFLEKLIANNAADAEKLLGWLRAWRMTSNVSCRFVFSGSIGFNSLLDRHNMSTRFNDCYDFRLGPFRPKAALEMLQEEARREGWQGDVAVFEYLCQRTGWLSPFYLNLLLVEACSAARDRELEAGQTNRQLQLSDIDDAYDRLLATRSRFIHWYQRLERDLEASDFTFARAILAAVAKADQGLTRKQLLSRLQRQEADPDQRNARLNSIMLKLEEDGYLSQEAERIQFLSFLLRDYWKRNHG